MAILAAYMVPHPPMIVPQVGKGSEKQIAKTIRAYETVADEIAALKPETILVSSPHSVLYADYFHVSPGRTAKGDFGRFGAGRVSFCETYDAELAERICAIAKEKDFPAGTLGERDSRLDHGTMVPLARETIEKYIRHRERNTVPAWVPAGMMEKKAGVFVSIHKDGRLRGCTGT